MLIYTFFAKFDSRDSLVFSKTTVDTNSFYGYDELKKVIATADGNWLTAGDQIDNSNVQGDANLVLTKIDTSGNALWSYRYGSQSDVAINFRDAVELPNGDFFILIVTHYEYYYNVGIIKISSTGQVNSFTVFNYPGIWEFGNVKIIAVQNNLVYCLVYGAICCFDFNGNNQWFKKLKAISAPDISPAVINDALLTPAGDFYVSGSTVVFNNDSIYSRTSSNFFLARLNASAQPMWMKKYGTCADEQGVGMALRGDGNLLVFGTTYRPNYFGEAILQTDSSGTSPCYYIADTLVIDTVLQLTGVTYPIPARNAWPVQDFSPFFMQNVSLHVSDYCSIPDTCLQVAIYDRVNEALSDLPAFIIKPNPATDFCTLHISPHNGLLSAQVIDFTGRKVLDLFTRSEASDFDFNIKSLAAGIYFLNISDEHGQHAAKKLVKVQ